MCPFTGAHEGDFSPLEPTPVPESQSDWSGRFWADLGERAASTFLQSLAGTSILMGATKLDWNDWEAVFATLVAPALLSLTKGLLANLKDSESGASLLPAPPGPEVNPEADEGEWH